MIESGPTFDQAKARPDRGRFFFQRRKGPSRLWRFVLLLVLISLSTSLCSVQILAESGARVDWVGQDEILAGLSSITEEELSHLDLDEVHSYLAQLDEETRELLPRWDPLEWIRSGVGLNFSRVLQNGAKLLWREVVVNFTLLGRVIILAVIGAVLTHFQQAWAGESLGHLVESVIYLILMGLSIQSFTFTLHLAHQVLERLINFVYALLPSVFALLTAAGGVTLTTVCHPIIWGGIGLVVHLIKGLALPVIYLSGTVGLVSRLAEGFTMGKLAALGRKLSIGLLGLFVSIFLGLVTVQGITVAVADGVTLRAARFITGNFLPLVGGAIADSIELAAGCSLLLKNALGAFGAVAAVIICIHPALKILAVSLIYQLAAALIQPLNQERLADSLQEIGGTIMVVFAAVAVTAMMVFFGLSVLVGLGNIMAMIR
ncbi:MAG TPA: stage III sporulation protein AE [Firmicutes bacterium]|nr:stage III sporulation protein AE [Bacillota bacterium]